MMYLLLIALVLFILGIFTVKVLWWAALVFAAIWLYGTLRSRGRVSS
ncbi:MAG: hydrophobic protein [Planctomycetaceae bacterium]